MRFSLAVAKTFVLVVHGISERLHFRDGVSHNFAGFIYEWIFFSIVFVGASSFGYAQEGGTESPRMLDGVWGSQAPAAYKILPRPATHHNRNQPHTNTPTTNTIHSQPVHPYAYGWFGTKPSPQWSRQFGYQKSYTQWTLR